MSTQTITRDASRVQPSTMNQPPQGQQNLVKAVPVSHLLDLIRKQPTELVACLAELQEHYHVIGAASVTDGFSELYGLSVSPVLINTRVNEWGQGPETYYDYGFMKAPGHKDESGEWVNELNADAAQRAIGKCGLDRIASASGLDWRPPLVESPEPNYCRYVANGDVTNPDGTPSDRANSFVADLREGSAQIGGWTPALWRELMDHNEAELKKAKTPADARQIRKRLDWSINGWSDKRVMQARRHIHTVAESKAKNRVVRELGVRQIYTVKELREKPFLCLKALLSPSIMRDPAVKQRVIDIAFLGNRILHGQGMPRVVSTPAVADDVIDVQPVSAHSAPAAASTPAGPVSTSSTAAPAAENTAAKLDPAIDTPVQIMKVAPQAGVSHGVEWTVWWFTFSDGRVAGTDDEELVKWGRKHKDDKAWVVPSIEKTEKGSLRLLELEAVPAPGASARVETAFPL